MDFHFPCVFASFPLVEGSDCLVLDHLSVHSLLTGGATLSATPASVALEGTSPKQEAGSAKYNLCPLCTQHFFSSASETSVPWFWSQRRPDKRVFGSKRGPSPLVGRQVHMQVLLVGASEAFWLAGSRAIILTSADGLLPGFWDGLVPKPVSSVTLRGGLFRPPTYRGQSEILILNVYICLRYLFSGSLIFLF